MSEDEIIDVLDLIIESIGLVQSRFREIGESDDFVSTSNGVTLLDAIAMRLQVIGESVKRLENKAPSLLDRHTGIEWNKIARFRDLVSHHYEHVDHEIIYDICQNHIPKLRDIIERMIKEVSEMEGLKER
ncbi:MAG: DUF86 domain-containing protein [Deltaproteobacteria bacterium]|nr:DUF86 domain-containing protein [Deltaproteobacteria bacterium]